MTEHEASAVSVHARMVVKAIIDITNQATRVDPGTQVVGQDFINQVDAAITRLEARATELTRQVEDVMTEVQRLKSEVQSQATAVDDAIAALQRALKELQDYYSDRALSVQTLQATSYSGIYIWNVPELTRRWRDQPLATSTDTIPFPSCQRASYCEMLEHNFPIETLVTQFLAEGILTQWEYEEIQSTPNHMEKN